jgi:Flp pilus assembly protein TadB
MDPMIATCIVVVLLLAGLVFWVLRNRRNRRTTMMTGRETAGNVRHGEEGGH